MDALIERSRSSVAMEISTSSIRTRTSRREGSLRRPQHMPCQNQEAGVSGEQQEAVVSCCSPLSEIGAHDVCHERRQSPSSHLPDDVSSAIRHDRRRHRFSHILTQQTMFSVIAAVALLLFSPSIVKQVASSPYQASSSALFVPPRSRNTSLAHSNHFMSTQRKPKENHPIKTVPTTWSNAVRQKSDLNESRFGVRNRVKKVLKKAKDRTGIENASSSSSSSSSSRINKESSPSVRSGANIVAETASIGAWDVEVALDMVSKVQEKNNNVVTSSKSRTSSDDETQLLPDEMTPSEEKYEDAAILSKFANEITGATKNGVKVTSTSAANNVATTERSSSTDESPEDDFILSSSSSSSSVTESESRNNTVKRKVSEKDAFTGDVSAAFSLPREPLPFELPSLDTEQYRRLMDGERVQYQDDMGRAGSGFVVWDVKAPSSVVWDCLLDFQSYPQTIPTVREVVMYTNTHLKEDYRAEKPVDFEDGTAAICKHGVPSVTRAQFALSKFRLKIAAVHKYRPHPKGDYMIFTLDPASSNMVLKYAKGIWYTESNPDGKEGYTRVWLLCELRVSRLLPQWIVDYAASRAMPRATTWLKPQVETAAQLWLKDSR